MASMEMKMYFERRECYVYNHSDRYGYFHCWANIDKGAMAIVELFSGTVILVEPKQIAFMDVFPDELERFNKKRDEFHKYRQERLFDLGEDI